METELPPEEIEVFKSLTDLQVIFDVGARVDTIYMEIHPDAEFHLFEPNPKFFEELKKKVGDKPNVHLNNYGLGDKEETLKYNEGLQAFMGGEAPVGSGTLELPIKTLDGYIEEKGIKRIDFLKIDTEGYDYKVLLGGKKAIRLARYIQYEHWDNLKEFHDLLEKDFKMEYIGYRNVLCTKTSKPKVVDVITFNGEYDLFDLRYNILKDYVDEFIVVDFDKTFSGKEKNAQAYKLQKYPKVKAFFVPEIFYNQYRELALSSPNTKGAEHWVREFCQKESIKDCLTHLKDDDIVFISDCDEIWSPNLLELKRPFPTPLKLKLKVYTYYLNNRSSEEFWGTIQTEYGYIKKGCLNHIRTNAEKANGIGWHFTSMANDLRKKLTDSYTAESYATPEVLNNLETNIKENKDFLGRPFTYTIDESEWPQYLKDNREKYKHLCK